MSEHKRRHHYKKMTNEEKRKELERGWTYYPAIMDDGRRGQLVRSSDAKFEQTGDRYTWTEPPKQNGDHKDAFGAMRNMGSWTEAPFYFVRKYLNNADRNDAKRTRRARRAQK